MEHKFKINDRVFYEGLVGIITEVIPIKNYFDFKPRYWLKSEKDEELITIAEEIDCRLLMEDEDIDQSTALSHIKSDNQFILSSINKITDKYIGDK